MKYKTFRLIILGAGLVGAGGLGYYVFGRTSHRTSASTPVASAPRMAPTPPPPIAMSSNPSPPAVPAPSPPIAMSSNPSPPAVPAPPSPAAPGALRPEDEQILAQVRAGITGDKMTDALKGAWKVNLYRDAGNAGVNRLKIDLDRDGKWDEKWNVKADGTVKREVAPADDEKYTETYVLDGTRWTRKP